MESQQQQPKQEEGGRRGGGDTGRTVMGYIHPSIQIGLERCPHDKYVPVYKPGEEAQKAKDEQWTKDVWEAGGCRIVDRVHALQRPEDGKGNCIECEKAGGPGKLKTAWVEVYSAADDDDNDNNNNNRMEEGDDEEKGYYPNDDEDYYPEDAHLRK